MSNNIVLDLHWIIIFIGIIILLWGISLLFLWHLRKKSLIRTMMESYSPIDEVLKENFYPEDKVALKVIEAYCNRFWKSLWISIKINHFIELSWKLTRDIAKIYHPCQETPELKASIAELIKLTQRLATRLDEMLQSIPFSKIKDMELQTVLSCHSIYGQIKNHPISDSIKKYRLNKIVQMGHQLWVLKNILNPCYWTRRLAFLGSKEIILRRCLSQTFLIIGEEAIKVYSGRNLSLNTIIKEKADTQQTTWISKYVWQRNPSKVKKEPSEPMNTEPIEIIPKTCDNFLKEPNSPIGLEATREREQPHTNDLKSQNETVIMGRNKSETMCSKCLDKLKKVFKFRRKSFC